MTCSYYYSLRNILLVFFILCIFNNCQRNIPKYKEIVVKVPGYITDYFLPESHLSGALVEIVQEGKVIYSQKAVDGKYILTPKMDISKKFFIRYSEKDYLTKQVLFDFKEDSLQKLGNWLDTIVLFDELNIELVYSSFLKKVDQPVLVAEFSLSNQKPYLNVSRTKDAKRLLENRLSSFSGKEKFFYENGNPKALITLKNGKLNGECIWWNVDGSLLKKATFTKGLEIK